MIVPQVPNPFDDDAQRLERVEAHLAVARRPWLAVFIGGGLVLGVWLALALAGWPGTGVVLVPIGLGMLLGAGIQLILARFSA